MSSGGKSDLDITEAEEKEGGIGYEINFDSERALIHVSQLKSEITRTRFSFS